ncbi:MAG: PilN domain-containing protein [Scytonematopsis contorta HA4267-MV1]|jgi:type IV pilus assembly protein PilN|nr:PilN domain-containing protein [Scytonematopsis contorta HA4267-MV1]
MYSLEVNFLKDRPTHSPKGSGKKPGISVPIGDLTPIYIGVALAVFFPVLTGLSWFLLQAKNTEVAEEIAKLEQENQKLEVEIGNIKKIQEETRKIKDENQSLVSVFDQIRPWSAMLQDFRERIPQTVQLENVKQITITPPAPSTPPPAPAAPADGSAPPAAAAVPAAPALPFPGVELAGFARSFNDVNDFLLTIQQSRFLKAKEARIISAELVDAPLQPGAPTAINGVPIKPIQVVKYTIQAGLSDIPASELMRELEQKGSVGLVSRIRSLQQQGVIKR